MADILGNAMEKIGTPWGNRNTMEKIGTPWGNRKDLQDK
ncbi:hypothetical protein HMPREF1508_0143 [Shuttleworthella sp. MSX8B]|nr:hypothetical protein HMPREF1508_0143 [Shuttleworthia sp. MSX8B]